MRATRVLSLAFAVGVAAASGARAQGLTLTSPDVAAGATIKADGRPDHTVDVLIGTEYAGMNPKAATSIAVPGGAVCLPASSTPTPSASASATPKG